MTVISLAELNRRRAEGTSPKGGTAPDYSHILSAPSLGARERLDAMLILQWNHPMDQGLMGKLTELVGCYPRATILIAADYAYETAAGRTSSTSSKTAYDQLVTGLNER